MQITKEMLTEKKDELLERREQLLGEANVCNGGIQSMDYLLDMLERPVPTESQGQSKDKLGSGSHPHSVLSLQAAINDAAKKDRIGEPAPSPPVKKQKTVGPTLVVSEKEKV